MKKALSLFLALMLCVGILAVPAFAEDDYAPFSFVYGDESYSVTVTLSDVKAENKTLTLIFPEDQVTGEVTLLKAKPGSTITLSDDLMSGDFQLTGESTYSSHGGFLMYGTIVIDEQIAELEKYEEQVDMIAIKGHIDNGAERWYCIVLDGAASATPAKPAVVRSPQNVTVDGKAVTPDIYNINDRNYFKLRDLASLLNGTGAQFEVGYNDATKTISITTGAAYTPVGGELAAGEDKSATCVESAQTLEINGAAASLTAYNIGGNNYFQLRELGAALGFGVDYDAATNTAIITTK